MRIVGEIVRNREVYVVDQNKPVREVARFMTGCNVGAVCVLDGNRLAGIFTERDLLKKVVARGADPDATLVGSVMTRRLIVAAPEEDADTCLRRMQAARVRHLPVVSQGRLLGVVSIRELFEYEAQDRTAELQMLVDYIQYVPPSVTVPSGIGPKV